MADAVEAARKHVQSESAQELERRELHRAATVAVDVVSVAKADGFCVGAQQAIVGNRRAVSVAAEVLEYLFGSGEWALGVDDPRGTAQRRCQSRRRGDLAQ